VASEAQLRCGLSIRKGGVVLINESYTFSADVEGTFGPSPGGITVSASGTDIDFSKFTTPGLALISNLEDPGSVTSYLTLGTYDPTTDVFTPVSEIHSGETFPLRFARFVGRESTGTGTLPGYDNKIQLRASSGVIRCSVKGFDA
jgi:hypothetical protein